jgi:uncharacterized protein (TIGR02001 family)
MSRHRLATAVLLLTLSGTPALAQGGPGSDWEVEGTLAAVSDYRYRGLSLSDGKAAAQAGATLSHASGVYGDAYISTVDEYGVGADGDGAKIEATLTLGWAGAVAGLDVDAAVAAYRYPDGDEVDYYEFPLQVGQTRGAVTWTLGGVWAPRGQTALGDRSNRYVWGGLDLAPERLPVQFRTSVGYESGAYAPGGKTDWLIGAAVSMGPAVLGVDYVDSDVASAAVVARLQLNF